MSPGRDGGNASVEGEDSTALGGNAGDAVLQPGGRGGHANVRGDRSYAQGGKGGRGGISPGMPGMDIKLQSDDAFTIGGNGGEAPQADGRGGRGGRAPMVDRALGKTAQSIRAHMRWPYGELVTEPGRGGDGADTPQYMARRLIVEDHKRAYFTRLGSGVDEAWWDRTVVPLDWLNRMLALHGHNWRTEIVDDEYEFEDAAPHGN